MKQRKEIRFIPALILFAFADSAISSGFQLQNQTGSGNGNAFAGAAATAEDAGTVFFNPAGMTYLPTGHNLSAGGTILYRSVRFTNNGSTDTAGFRFTDNGLTGNGGNAGGVGLLPVGYWSYSISPALRVGFGVSSIYGSKTEYDFDFIGRNAGYSNEIKQINFNPAVAFKVNEALSLGGGLNLAHMSVDLKQGVALVNPGIGAPANNFVEVTGKDWALGLNVGAMFQLTPVTRLGLAYRSKMKFDLDGTYKPDTQVAAIGLVNQDTTAELRTPTNVSLSISHKLNDQLELLGDVTWTEWSVLQSLTIKNRSTGADVSSINFNLHDTLRVSLGANYQLNDQWKIRFGIAADEAPVKSAADRTMTLPDSNRTWLSFGGKYALSDHSSIDFGYTHIFFKKASAERDVVLGGTTRQTIRGDWDNSADLLSVQFNQKF